MAKKKYEEANIQAIAETIREKTGTEQTYKASEMASGVSEVYDKGRTDEWSDFWDKYQEKGTKSQYLYSFAGHSWTDETFKPKHNISPSYSCQYMFTYSRITDLAGILKRQNVTLNLSRANSVASAFQYCDKLTNLPEINLSGITSAGNANMLFDSATSLETIEKLVFSNTSGINYAYAFKSCTKLKNVVFEGRVTRSIDLHWSSSLSVESMKSLIACLEDYSTASTGVYTVTFNDDCWEALEADSSAPDGKTWREYVETTLGWLT